MKELGGQQIIDTTAGSSTEGFHFYTLEDMRRAVDGNARLKPQVNDGSHPDLEGRFPVRHVGLLADGSSREVQRFTDDPRVPIETITVAEKVNTGGISGVLRRIPVLARVWRISPGADGKENAVCYLTDGQGNWYRQSSSERSHDAENRVVRWVLGRAIYVSEEDDKKQIKEILNS